MNYKYDKERAMKAFKNAPKPRTLDKRLNDISYHLHKLIEAIEDLNYNINDLREEINENQ